MRNDPRYSVHSLLQVGEIGALSWDTAQPDWAVESLHRAPWVVVRRCARRATLLPVGVRGEARAQRCAAWLPEEAVNDTLTPSMLAAAAGWRRHPRIEQIPALAALEAVRDIFETRGLRGRWGPCGSVGFELASGLPCASQHSDLDLMLCAPEPITVRAADALRMALARLPARIDVLLETPAGAVALAEHADGKRIVMLRSPAGARLVSDPWLAVTGERG